MSDEQEGDLLTDGISDGASGNEGNQRTAGSGSTGSGDSGAPGETKAPGYDAQLPDALKGHKSLAKLPRIGDLAQAYIELEGRQGNSVQIPGADASPADWNKVYGLLGRPETKDAYDFTNVPVPPGVTLTDEAKALYQGIAFDSGLNNVQAGKLLEWHQGVVATAFKALAARKAEAKEKLQQDWGDQYEGKMEMGLRTLKKFASPASDGTPNEFVTFLKETGLGNDPRMSKFLADVGGAMGEDVLPKGEGGSAAPESAHGFPVAAAAAARRQGNQ